MENEVVQASEFPLPNSEVVLKGLGEGLPLNGLVAPTKMEGIPLDGLPKNTILT